MESDLQALAVSWSAPSNETASACRSNSVLSEAEATTFSILYLEIGTPDQALVSNGSYMNQYVILGFYVNDSNANPG